MSQVSQARVGSRRLRSTSNAALALWHVGCCLLGEGCLYVAPIEMMPVNSPPEIQEPDDLINEKVLIADVEYVLVAATDPDEDPLYFFWSGVPADVEIPPEPPIPKVNDDGVTMWTSLYKVPRDPRLDGRAIQVKVSDLEPLDDVTVQWLLTVEE